MTHPTQPTSLRAFTIICIGQVATLLGSNMTSFAIIIWAWRLTGEATPLSLLAFFNVQQKHWSIAIAFKTICFRFLCGRT